MIKLTLRSTMNVKLNKKKKIFYWGELIPVNSEVPEPLKRITKDGIRQN